MSLQKKLQGVRERWFWVVLGVIYAGIFLTILVFAYQGKLPSFLTQNDKVAHLILYAIAAFIGHRLFNRHHLAFNGFSLPLFPLMFLLFTIAEELMQSLSPNRSLDAWDLIASIAGISVGYWLGQQGRRK
ncbi:MAG: VanZ family protein [Leptolyngbyaceae cyanobacterium bins.302]|nr:VanZ family protein [Leptolyngbyaceae cyanobacterium bins.302]